MAAEGSRSVGFASVGPTDCASDFKLHKLYILPDCQGRGVGSRLLDAVLRQARNAGATRLILCVNKQNHAALAAYRAWRFRVKESLCVDIGGGYVMDDYLMQLEL